MEKYYTERITDISYDCCNFISKNNVSKTELENLYNYHKSNNNIYPMTNWMAHRLMVLSLIAVKLNDQTKIKECHNLIIKYISTDSVCLNCKCGANQDFHWRDSINYLVYGCQALANSCLYLKPYTKFNYKALFEKHLKFLKPYLEGTKKHIEYRNSEIKSDVNKPEYNKEWQPLYAVQFLNLVSKM